MKYSLIFFAFVLGLIIGLSQTSHPEIVEKPAEELNLGAVAPVTDTGGWQEKPFTRPINGQ